MEHIKSKPLSSVMFIPLLFLIFVGPFFSGLAYPALEVYYQNLVIFLAIIVLLAKRKHILKNTYMLPLSLLLLSYIISTAFSVNLQNSVAEIIKFISYLCVFFIVSQTDYKQKKILIKAIVIAASIISLYSIYQYFWGYEHTLDYLKKVNSTFLATSSYAKDILIAKRAIGTFPSPTIFGGYLIVAFFLLLHLLFERHQRMTQELFVPGAMNHIPTLLFTAIITFALILTKSMGAWLSLIAGLIMLFILSYKYLKQRRLILALSLIVIISVLTFILVGRWERLTNLENPENSIIQRLNYWRTAIAIIKDHPIVGVGPGNFQEVFLKYKVGMSTDTRYAHNILLHQWAEIGLLGLVGIIYLIISFFRKFKTQPEHKFILLAGLAFILHNLTDNTYFIPQVGIFWWVLLALLI